MSKLPEKTSVSVCMIVRNEEAMLPDCLASVRPIATEIITNGLSRIKELRAGHAMA